MKKTRKRSECPISSALELIGDKWSLLIIRDMMIRGKFQIGEFPPDHHVPYDKERPLISDELQRGADGAFRSFSGLFHRIIFIGSFSSIPRNLHIASSVRILALAYHKY